MRRFYAGRKNRLGQRRDSELLAENDSSKQPWFIFSFKSSSYLMLEPVARTMLAIYELSPTDILHLYLANVSFFFFTSSFQLLLWQCCPYVVVMLRYKNISVWVRKRSHFCFLRLWKIVPTSCQNHMVLHCRSPWQKYPVMLQPQAHLCSLYMRKCIS